MKPADVKSNFSLRLGQTAIVLCKVNDRRENSVITLPFSWKLRVYLQNLMTQDNLMILVNVFILVIFYSNDSCKSHDSSESEFFYSDNSNIKFSQLSVECCDCGEYGDSSQFQGSFEFFWIWLFPSIWWFWWSKWIRWFGWIWKFLWLWWFMQLL